jgi:hypothetical protein
VPFRASNRLVVPGGTVSSIAVQNRVAAPVLVADSRTMQEDVDFAI